MKHLFLIILLNFSLLSFAQSSRKVDSLKTILHQYPERKNTFQHDTIRVRLLCAIAKELANQPDSSIKYSKKAKNIAEQLNWVEGKYESGFIYAADLYHKNLYYQALEVYFDLLALTEKNHQRIREAIIIRAIGDSYLSVNDYKLAKKSYLNSMAIFRELKEYEDLADTQNNLAIAHTNIGEYYKAIELLNDCLNYLPYIKGKWSEINFYDNLAIAYNFLHKNDLALKYALIAVEKTRKLGHDNDLWKSQVMIIAGDVYQSIGENDKALYYADWAKKCLPNDGNDDIDLSELYFKSFKGKKEYKKALYYLELFKKNVDGKTQLEQSQSLASLKSLYDLEKEKDKVSLLNVNLEKESFQKKVGFAGLLVISGFLIFIYWSFISQKRKNKLIEKQKMAIEELNSSLEYKVMIRTQELSSANQELIRKNQEISEALFKGQSIERTRVASALHDNLGGAVAALKWMLESIDVDNLSEDDKKIYANALKITSETYLDVRFMSHNFIPEVLAQLGLQNAIKKLCHEITQTKRLEIYFEDKTSTSFTHQIQLEVYAICLELITNILKHSKATKASVLMNENDDVLQIIVSDNGIGISKKDSSGKGLKNIRKRLESIKGTIEIMSIVNEQSSFSMTIPLVTQEEYMNLPDENHIV